MAWDDTTAHQRVLDLAQLTPDDWRRTVAKPSEPFWPPMQVPDFPEEFSGRDPESEPVFGGMISYWGEGTSAKLGGVRQSRWRAVWGFWPSFAFGGLALVFTFSGWLVPSFAATGVSLLCTWARMTHLRPRVVVDLRKVVELAAARGTRRSFEPFTACPGCGEMGLHLLGRRHQAGETAPSYLHVPAGAQPDIWWPLDDYESVRTNCDGVNYRIRNGKSCPSRTFMVVDRECMSCGKTWEEAT